MTHSDIGSTITHLTLDVSVYGVASRKVFYCIYGSVVFERMTHSDIGSTITLLFYGVA